MPRGFLLIGRQDHTDGLPGASRPTVVLPIEALHERYRGIEGEPWPNRSPRLGDHLVEGLLSGDSLAAGQKYYEFVAKQFLCDWLYIEPFNSSGGIDELPREFTMLGFDFGHFHEVSKDYITSKSHIYSEVLYGEHDELREMVSELNDNLLFREPKILKNFARALQRNLATGNQEMTEALLGQGYAVFGLPSAQRLITKKFVEPENFME